MATYEKIHPRIKYGLTQRDRITALKSALQIADQTYTIKLKGGQSLTLDVKKIEVDKLRYRIKNNRARSAQNIWIEKNEDKIVEYIKVYKLKDVQPRINYPDRTNWLREQDPEHEIIQKIQHEILNNNNIIKNRIKLTVNPNIKIIFVKERNEKPELAIATISVSETSLLMA